MATHMVAGAHRCDRITPILEYRYLHWLPVSQRVVFKTALMIWKCIHGVAPVYLSDLCISATTTSGQQNLRSASLLNSTCFVHANCGGAAVLLPMDQPPGTGCCLHYEHQSCHRTPLHMCTEDSPVLDCPAML